MGIMVILYLHAGDSLWTEACFRPSICPSVHLSFSCEHFNKPSWEYFFKFNAKVRLDWQINKNIQNIFGHLNPTSQEHMEWISSKLVQTLRWSKVKFMVTSRSCEHDITRTTIWHYITSPHPTDIHLDLMMAWFEFDVQSTLLFNKNYSIQQTNEACYVENTIKRHIKNI